MDAEISAGRLPPPAIAIKICSLLAPMETVGLRHTGLLAVGHMKKAGRTYMLLSRASSTAQNDVAALTENRPVLSIGMCW